MATLETTPSAEGSGRQPVAGNGGAIDVVYIAGDGRSGSTLLSRLLNQVPGWLSLGEVRYFHERGLQQDRACECGRPFSECPLWSAVAAELRTSGLLDPADAAAAEHALLRLRRAHRALRRADEPERWVSGAGDYVRQMDAVYRSVQRLSGARVLVDSSKLPQYGQVLRTAESVRLHVLHLVRDPRATVHSWRRAKPLEAHAPRSVMPQRSLLRSVGVWTAANVLTQRLLDDRVESSHRMRYEDLVEAPVETLRAAIDALGLEGVVPPSLAGRELDLLPGHGLAGNPDRLRKGPVVLRLDDAWRSEMPRRDAALVSGLTSGLRERYGFA
jgi:hypothetical protein